MFNIHMKENSSYMILGQGQSSNTLERKGNHICFYGYRLFSLSSTFTSLTLHTYEFPTAFTRITTHVEFGVWQVRTEKIEKHFGCLSWCWHLLENKVFLWDRRRKNGFRLVILTSRGGVCSLIDASRSHLISFLQLRYSMSSCWGHEFTAAALCICSLCVIGGIFRTEVDTVSLQPDSDQGIEMLLGVCLQWGVFDHVSLCLCDT